MQSDRTSNLFNHLFPTTLYLIDAAYGETPQNVPTRLLTGWDLFCREPKTSFAFLVAFDGTDSIRFHFGKEGIDSEL
jgi:hypothetical protein